MLDITLATTPSNIPIAAKLRVPTPDEECPILHEDIATASFDRLARPYASDYPELKALTLHCGHTFHAMALIYNWARNRNVLCPVCRAGPPNRRLVMNQLPKEWRYSLQSRIRRERKQDRIDDEEQNHQMALQLSQTHQDRLSLSMRITIETPYEGSITLGMHMQPTGGDLEFFVPSDQLRTLSFRPGSFVRMFPHTHIHTLRSSPWFKVGEAPHHGFHVEYDDQCNFRRIALSLPEATVVTMLTDMFVWGRAENTLVSFVIFEN